MKNLVAVYKTKKCTYPDQTGGFRPSNIYPEYPFTEVDNKTNEVYEAVRQSFYMLGLDKDRYGSSEWNPLGDVINQGDTVLIKPNLVMDVNPTGEGTECMYTQAAVVAPVIDYCLLALKGTGRIVIGDAPMQECNFENLIEEGGYRDLIDFYKNKGISIELVDFRELKSVIEHGVHKNTFNPNAMGKVIDLAESSEFAGESSERMRRMRITNYDPDIMLQHHTEEKNEYYISSYVLSADVIINMPKPKCHRKAGATISLKNMVGINVRKEYLPHHTMGSVADGGDEYQVKSRIHRLRSHLLDKKYKLEASGKYPQARILRYVIMITKLWLLLFTDKKKLYFEGSWHGNRTICQTISDLNKILFYADKNGVMQNSRQRKMLIIGDMLISGEHEGPVMPSRKEVGIIVCGFDPISYDIAVSRLMGFDYHKIPAITTALNVKGRYQISQNSENVEIVSNDERFNKISPEKILKENTFKFIPSSGWVNHIEIS